MMYYQIKLTGCHAVVLRRLVGIYHADIYLTARAIFLAAHGPPDYFHPARPRPREALRSLRASFPARIEAESMPAHSRHSRSCVRHPTLARHVDSAMLIWRVASSDGA